MELSCYIYPHWKPLIRPAPMQRTWMDETPNQFAYRCLPLNIANQHGWEILSPSSFEASWSGNPNFNGVKIKPLLPNNSEILPTSHFGSGILTFHINGLFHTSPGWDLWVSGPVNSPKDGIYPLTGIIETDWSPYTFTMNWIFTRPNTTIKFEENEPICSFFPIAKNIIENIQPSFVEIDKNPQLKSQYETWTQSRNEFNNNLKTGSAQGWQKRYFQGVYMDGNKSPTEHRTKIKLNPFK